MEPNGRTGYDSGGELHRDRRIKEYGRKISDMRGFAGGDLDGNL